MNGPVITGRGLRALPGPRGLPLVGNLLEIETSSLHQQLERWGDEFGPIYRLRLGPKTRVVITDTEAINHMLRERPEHYRRPRVTERVMQEMGFHGVFSADGDAWRRQRKVVALALNPSHLNRFYPAMATTSSRLLQHWTTAAEQHDTVDACRDLMRFTVDVTAHLAFGMDVNTLETDGPVIQRHLDKVFPMLFRRVIAPFPLWRYWRSKADRELDDALVEIRHAVNDITNECHRRMRADQSLFEHPTNFLEAMIAAQRSESVEFTQEEIHANVINLLLAGEDTTANTIAWAIKFFIDHPALFATARAEVDAAFGDARVAPDLDALRKLEFIDAFAHETMRLKPVAPLLGIEPKQDVELLGYRIPARTPMLALTRMNALADENFKAAATFNPERWLDAEGERDGAHNPRAFMPFGAGPRFCPGRGLAMVEIKAVLALVCRNFNLRLADPTRPITEKLAFTMFPDGLAIKLGRRVV